MNIGTELLKNGICPVCGSEFKRTALVGRTREYCSDNCRNFNKYFTALQSCVCSFNTLDYKYKNMLRSRFFKLSNELNNKKVSK